MHQLGRRERKKQEVSDRIREAAIALFREKGYEAATVGEIAERADVSKGTVFNYYPRKESLLALAADDLIERTKSVIGPPETWQGSMQDKVRRLFLGMVEVTAQHPDLSRTLLFDCIKRPHVYAYEDPSQSEMRSMLRLVLREARESGEIRSDVDQGVAARLLESVFFNALLFWLVRGQPESELRQELTARLDLVFHGLVPPAEVMS